MKKQTSIINLILISAVLFGMAFKCGNNNQRTLKKPTPYPSPTTQNKTGNGFEDGHLLKGRFVNTDQGIRSFTFYTNGRFERGGAASGSIPGGNGDYVSSSMTSGTYYLSGNTLTLTDEKGQSVALSIEINNKSDYSLETPVRLRIDETTYINVNN